MGAIDAMGITPKIKTEHGVDIEELKAASVEKEVQDEKDIVKEIKKLPPPSEPKPDEIKNVVKDVGALKSLMFCYSDSESDQDQDDGSTTLSSKPPLSQVDQQQKQDDGKKDEIKTDAKDESALEDPIKAPQAEESEKNPNLTTKQHPLSRNQQKQQSNGNKNNRNQRNNNNRRNQNNSRDKQLLTTLNQPSLLRKLLEPEIRKERNDILQAIRYIVKNNFFDNFPPPTTK